MSRYICTCPECKANFEVLTDEKSRQISCPACSCKIQPSKAKTEEIKDSSGCSHCSGCSGC